ncbi:hypothetical protein CL618_02110 [archaeon]|nr:hypothetical protein [archaeon]|tara:strand:+ start:110 stop:544 length:435 start_codon:yes stop_codon:yes gene_type:complete
MFKYEQCFLIVRGDYMAKQNNQKTFITAAVLVVAVAFFMNSGITGNVTKCNAEASVVVSPLEIPAGNYVTISVEPGAEGAKSSARIINSEDTVMSLTAPRHTTRIYYDKQTWSYKSGNNWEKGNYRVRVDNKEGCSAYGQFRIV